MIILHKYKKPCNFAPESLIINCINYSKSLDNIDLNTFCV